MRNTFLIALLAVLGFVGFQQWSGYAERQRVEAEAVERRAKKVQAAQAKAEKKAASSSNRTKIKCAYCDGIGRLTVSLPSGEKKLTTCRVCNFAGYREIVMPPSSLICKDCKGMGKLPDYKPSKNRLRSRACELCSGRGFTLARPLP